MESTRSRPKDQESKRSPSRREDTLPSPSGKYEVREDTKYYTIFFFPEKDIFTTQCKKCGRLKEFPTYRQVRLSSISHQRHCLGTAETAPITPPLLLSEETEGGEFSDIFEEIPKMRKLREFSREKKRLVKEDPSLAELLFPEPSERGAEPSTSRLVDVQVYRILKDIESGQGSPSDSKMEEKIRELEKKLEDSERKREEESRKREMDNLSQKIDLLAQKIDSSDSSTIEGRYSSINKGLDKVESLAQSMLRLQEKYFTLSMGGIKPLPSPKREKEGKITDLTDFMPPEFVE